MSKSEQRFEGKVVVITGAGSGIGAAIARRFVSEGATVVGVDIAEAALNKTRAALPTPERFVPKVADVSNSAQVDTLIAEVAVELDGIDVLINNAGIAPTGRAGDTSDDLWRKVFSIDVDGVFYLTRAALPHLAARRGSVVNTASVSGLAADYAYSAYNAAKGAVINFTRSVAIDYGKLGVRVNAVAPGPVRTPLIEKNFTEVEGLEAAFDRFVPLGRIADAYDDIAPVFAFLASDEARFITGITIPVDGGVTAWNGQPNGDFIG